MLALDVLPFVQIGQRPGYLEYAMQGAQGKFQALSGSLQPATVRFGERTVAVHAQQVEVGVGTALAGQLPLPCGADPLADLAGGGFAAARLQAGAFAEHADVQVDALEQRSGELAAIALDLLRGAAAAAAGIAEVAAGAGVHLELLLASPVEGNRTVVEHAPETQLLESKNG